MYDRDFGQNMVPAGTAVLGSEDLAAAPAVHGEFLISKGIRVTQIKFHVTTAVVATTTAPVVAVKKRPTPGSSSGEVTIGLLTIPNGTAVSKIVYKNVTPVELAPGDSLAFEHTVQAAGTPAGAGYYSVDYDIDPEVPANLSDMVASA